MVKLAYEPTGVEKSKGRDLAGCLQGADEPVLVTRSGRAGLLYLLKTHAPDVDAGSGTGVAGYLVAALMAHVLRTADDDLSRENVRRVASSLKDLRLPILLPGVLMSNSTAALHVYAVLQPVRFNGVELDAVGPTLNMN